MQVAHSSDHITHAVLGGMDNISFGISDDPAFFQILSSALYKDPMKAMVRETICNGWDAHIDSDRADRPMSITLDEEKLVIRDYGKGIPHELIGPIFGVYGASTKKNDGRQTGGFGLGCKSPFAYTDHFQVVSNHGGVRTIYNMSKSSAERMGKPSIVPIASFPTDESGIEVTIELKGDQLDYRIKDLVREVVFNGDIKAMLNGEMLPVLGLSQAESGFILVNDNASTNLPIVAFSNGRLFVRYGNVIYPIEKAPEIENMWGKVANMLEKIYKCRLVLMAPPDSISITPSRESLTMSTITVETLMMLLGGFLAKIMQNRDLMKRHDELVTEYIDIAATEEKSLTSKLQIGAWRVPGVPTVHENKFLSTTEDFALLEVLLRYNGASGQLPVNKWLSTMGRYLGKMRDNNLIERGLLSTWFQVARKAKKVLVDPDRNYYSRRRLEYNLTSEKSRWNEQTAATSWWRKRVMLPLLDKLMPLSDLIKPEMLFYMSPNLVNKDHSRGRAVPKKVASVVLATHTQNLHHLVMPTLVLCHNNNIITERFERGHDATMFGSKQFGAYFVLEIPRAKEKFDEIMKAIEDIKGVELVDMTGRTESEESAFQLRAQIAKKKHEDYLAANPTQPKPPRKVKAGLFRMDGLIQPDSKKLNTLRYQTEATTAQRITGHTFIEKISMSSDLMNFTEELRLEELAWAVAKLWGHLGGVTNNKGVYERQIQKGSMNINAFLADKVVNEISNSPTILAHMAFDAKKVENYVRSHFGYHKSETVNRLYRILMSTPELNSLIPNFTPLSDDDALRVIVWDGLSETYNWTRTNQVVDAAKVLNDVELDPGLVKFLGELCKSAFLDLLDLDHLQKQIVEYRADPTAMVRLNTIITNLVK